MTDIDWSKAPEGATHYFPSTEEWYMAGNGCAPLVWTGMWCKAFQFAKREHKCIKRPTAPSWSGEGLPPVGTECELHHETWGNNIWQKVTVKYASNEYFITADVAGEQHWHSRNTLLRPIRTPEQIAKDERDKAIDEIRRELMPADEYVAELILDAITRLGYRKP